MAKKKETLPGKRGPRREHSKDEPDEHDFPAAADCLTLLVSDQVAASLVNGDADIPCRLVDLP